MSDGARDLLVRGIAAAKANDPKEARFYLEWALRSDPDPDQKIEAWLYLADLTSDHAEKRHLLELALAINLNEPRARRKLAILEGQLDPADVIDPDQLQPPVTEMVPAEKTQRFVCPQCGAVMTYTPDGQALVCEHCSRREKIVSAPRPVGEQDFILTLATAQGHLTPVNRRTFSCSGCGAEFVLAPERLTANCPYCESTYVVSNTETKAFIPPGGIIPFGVSKQEAQQALKYWFQDHAVRPQSVTGMGLYIPAWIFNLTGTIHWRGWRSENRKMHLVEGDHPVGLSDILVPAGAKLSKALVQEIQNFDLEKLVVYDERYLASASAETYQIPLADASLEARRIALEEHNRIIEGNLSGDYDDLTLSSAGLYVDSFMLVLLPVWMAHYTYEGDRFKAVVNGQTAHVSGDMMEQNPMSWFKGWLARH